MTRAPGFPVPPFALDRSRLPVTASPDPDATAVHDPAALVRGRAALVDRALAEVAAALPDHPPSLYDPVRFVLEARGKRLRPAVVVLAAEAFGALPETALPAALAAEVFHAFTLVHDDIMDHSDERRGRPTVHVRWDEPTAVLAGDFLMGLAYDLLDRAETDRRAPVQAAWHRMMRRLCEGQAMDKAFETAADVSVADYLAMIDGKTAALLACCFELGARLGGAPDPAARALHDAGLDLGRAFQIQDDLLDLTADSDDWGKPIGGDLLEGKRTFLLLTALERAGQPAADASDAAFFSPSPEWPTPGSDRRGSRADGSPRRAGGRRRRRRPVRGARDKTRCAQRCRPDRPPTLFSTWRRGSAAAPVSLHPSTRPPMSYVERDVTVRNRAGLHTRPASMVVRTASKFESEFFIRKDGYEINGKSIIGVMTLAAEQGATLQLIFEGADAETAADAMAAVFESGFGEEL